MMAMASGPVRANWSVGLFNLQDCYLLSRWPHEEDPMAWRASTMLRTYAHVWEVWLGRFRATGCTDPAG